MTDRDTSYRRKPRRPAAEEDHKEIRDAGSYYRDRDEYFRERDRYYAAISSYRDKEKYSTRPKSKTEKMAKLLAESELESMQMWLNVFVENNNEDISFGPNINM